MQLIDTLATADVLLGLLTAGLLNLAVMVIEYRLPASLAQSPPSEWIAYRVLLPIGRILAVLAFILVAYPTLFGLGGAPSAASLIANGEGRFSHLINAAFLASLLLPFVPVIGRIPGAVLPVQGLIATAMLLVWMAAALGLKPNLWPGWPVLGFVAGWAVGSEWLARQTAFALGEHLYMRTGYAGTEQALYGFLVLFLQLPAILIYSLKIGTQLVP